MRDSTESGEVNMRRHIVWLLLAGIWLLAAVFNAIDGRNPLAIGYNVLAALMFPVLTIGQIHFDKQGAPGKKRMKLLCAAAFVLLILCLVFVPALA